MNENTQEMFEEKIQELKDVIESKRYENRTLSKRLIETETKLQNICKHEKVCYPKGIYSTQLDDYDSNELFCAICGKKLNERPIDSKMVGGFE